MIERFAPPPLYEGIPPESLAVKENGPDFLEDYYTDSKHSVTLLESGLTGLVYWVKDTTDSRILKLTPYGLEREILKAVSTTAPVPALFSNQIISLSNSQKRSVYFMTMEAITNEDGSIAETVADFLENNQENPAVINSLAMTIASGLAKWHSVPSEKYKVRSWASCLEQVYILGKDAFDKVGVSEHQQYKLRNALYEIPFGNSTWIHGDPGFGNLLIQDKNPEKITMIDPNTLIPVGDSLYDLAMFANNKLRYELEEHLEEKDKGFLWVNKWYQQIYKPLVKYYAEITGEPIDSRRLAANQLLQQLQYGFPSQQREQSAQPALQIMIPQLVHQIIA